MREKERISGIQKFASGGVRLFIVRPMPEVSPGRWPRRTQWIEKPDPMPQIGDEP